MMPEPQIQSELCATGSATARGAPARAGGFGRQGVRAGSADEEQGGNVEEGVSAAVGEVTEWRGGGESSVGRDLLVGDDDEIYFGVRPDFSRGRQTMDGFHRALGSGNFNGPEEL
jgi:hypothetical protein